MTHLPDTFPPSPFTVLQKAMDATRGARVSLGQLRDALGDKSFGYLMVLSVLPSIIPLPGLGSVFGILPLLLGVHLVLGGQTPWLPGFILNYKFPKKSLENMFTQLEPYWRKYAAFIRPGWPVLCGRMAERWMGVFVIFMSVIIILPGPLTNILPALVLLVLGLGLIVRDGRIIALSYLCGLASVIILSLVYGSLFYLLALGVKEVQTITNI